MKRFTKLFSTVFLLLAGCATVNAQEDEIFDFDASFYHNWSEVSATAVDNGVADGGVVLGEEVALGGTIWGNLTGAVPYLSYANITDYSEMRFEGTPGAVIRLMCNRTENEGPIYEIKPTIGDDGKLTVSISDLKFLNGGAACDFVCLQSIKVPAGWQGGTTAATITSIKIVKPGDPLANNKTDLKNALNSAKLKSPYAKTQASWDALVDAIANGEAALAADDATAASLDAATKDVNDAIAGLKLTVGYSLLTADMFQSHQEQGGEGQATGCAYDLNVSTGMPYGDGNVYWLNYADLSAYDKLIVVAAAGTPRFCMNRTADNAQDNDDPETSQFIDIPGHAWGGEAYQSKDGDNVWVIDLKKMVAERGIAYLHSIKGAFYANVTVTDMLLYKDYSFAVVGDLTGGWDTDVEMQASSTEGVYTLTVSGFEAQTGEYKYKMRANKAWGIFELPAVGDKVWNCTEAGIYDLTITADVLNYTIGIDAVKVGDVATSDAKYYLVGNFTNWAIADAYEMTRNADSDTEEYQITVTLPADAQFKAVKLVGDTQTWYPDGMGNAYGENGELTGGAGEYNVYFRPNLDGGADWFYSCIYVASATSTGISSTTVSAQPATVVFDLQGRRVQTMQKGLYIVNGKKVLK